MVFVFIIFFCAFRYNNHAAHSFQARNFKPILKWTQFSRTLYMGFLSTHTSTGISGETKRWTPKSSTYSSNNNYQPINRSPRTPIPFSNTTPEISGGGIQTMGLKRVYVPRNKLSQGGLTQSRPQQSNGVIVLVDPKRLLSYKYPKTISQMKQLLLQGQDRSGNNVSNEDDTSVASESNEVSKTSFSTVVEKPVGDHHDISKSRVLNRRKSTSSIVKGIDSSEKNIRRYQDFDGGVNNLSQIPWEVLCTLDKEGVKACDIAAILRDSYGVSTTAAAIEARLLDRKNPRRGKYRSSRPSYQTDKSLLKPIVKKEGCVVKLPLVESICVNDLAKIMCESSSSIIKFLMFHEGLMISMNQSIKRETAIQVIEGFGISWEDDVDENNFEKFNSIIRPECRVSRAPVVTIMGHVDHGKTTILDFYRKSSVAGSEAGGITQAISAFNIPVGTDRNITFIDTPGHASFMDMRKRGAKVTDIVILVIAADDGIMEQTLECIEAAHAENCPLVVAINKIDKGNTALVEKIKQNLLTHDVVLEEFGGDVQCAVISAKSGEGMELLLEKILIQADIMQLTANVNTSPEGSIIESSVDKGLGFVGTIILSNGYLSVGDYIVAGESWGKVRTLINDKNSRISKATPGMPVKVAGFQSLPRAGENVIVVSGEEEAKRLVLNRLGVLKEKADVNDVVSRVLDSFSSNGIERCVSSMPIILKTDTMGSMEAIRSAVLLLNASDHRNVAKVDIVHDGIGDISSSDIALASATGRRIFAFNTGSCPQVNVLARANNVEIIHHTVLYDLLNEVELCLKKSLSPPVDGSIVGNALVRKVFHIGKSAKIAGCEVTEGVIMCSANARVIRDGKVVYDGFMNSLKIVKTAVTEVQNGAECGVGFKDFNDIQEGDIIQSYQK